MQAIKLIKEIQNEIASVYYGRWDDLADNLKVNLFYAVAETYANERLAEYKEEITSLQAHIEELKSEITVLKSTKQ